MRPELPSHLRESECGRTSPELPAFRKTRASPAPTGSPPRATVHSSPTATPVRRRRRQAWSNGREDFHKKDKKSWRVFLSTALEKTNPISQEGRGAIGIDLNSDHIAYVETDRFGNPIDRKRLSWISYGKSKNQIRAITGDLCKAILDKAKETNKPIVIEKLDFQKKKLSLKEKGCDKLSRLLSGFAYGLFFDFLMARAYKDGVIVHQVNPAFTSIIGRINYAKRYGLSIHLAAALTIARRYQKFSETPCSPEGMIPDGKGGHVAFVLPARNRTKHVWHFWGQVKKKLTTVLAAHFQAIRNRSSSPPSSTHVI